MYRKRNNSSITPTKSEEKKQRIIPLTPELQDKMAAMDTGGNKMTASMLVKSMENIVDRLKVTIPDISEREITLVTTALGFMEEEFNKAIEFLNGNMNDLRNELQSVGIKSKDAVTVNTSLENEVQSLKSANKKIEQDQLESTIYSMRNNLVLSGKNITPYRLGVTEYDLREWLASILRRLGCQRDVAIERIHWLEGRRNLIIRFKYFSDRQDFWVERFRLNRLLGNVFVSEHFPPIVNEARKTLLPIFQEAKSQKMHAKLVANKLYIKGRIYTMETLDELPIALRPIRFGYKESDASHVFT